MRIIIYQLVPRLFGNTNYRCIPNGTLKQNGCGKLNDITFKVLKSIKDLGVTHIWYTGLLEHATQTDYTFLGIHKDHSAIVKGKAGSPYAIKDYYDIDPDLASKPELRFQEFRNLLNRTHKAGLNFVMDFVPNHVARQYYSDNMPVGTKNLGSEDKKDRAFDAQNNFYYIPSTSLECNFDMKENEPAPYYEMPAKVTGNDCFSSTPGRNDWYETIKLNYGVDYQNGNSSHFNPIPNTWGKMKDILLFWATEGVDAFRCDMAEMVPCEFWNWVIPQIKKVYPKMLFIGEVYNPAQYRDYLSQGGFDLLYDKVGLYDTLRAVTCGQKPASAITQCWQNVQDIKNNMLNFLENHDEQRIASNFFAGNGNHAKAALIVSACMGQNPFMLYNGQELGERGMEKEGFSGLDGRTTIFDYWSMETLRQWFNYGNCDGKLLPQKNKNLRQFYKKILTLCNKSSALKEGQFFDLMYVNYNNSYFNANKTFAFIRSTEKEKLFIMANFYTEEVYQEVNIPHHAFDLLKLQSGDFWGKDLISGSSQKIHLFRDEPFSVKIPAFSGVIISIQEPL